MICHTVVTFGLLVALRAASACPTVCECYHNHLLTELYNYHDSFTASCRRAGLKTLPVGLESETRHLDLSYNNITVLYSDSFSSAEIVMVLSLYLDHNNINTINVDTFSKLTELRKLTLDNNYITFLEPDTFRNCPNLWSLGLSGNQPDLPWNTHFLNIPGLQALDMSNSEMSQVPNTLLQTSKLKLQELKLNKNNIQNVNIHSFPTLLLLELNDNNIEYLDIKTFYVTPELTHLSLNGNPLQLNKDDSIIISQSLQYLYLNNCGFKDFTENTFRGTPNLIEMYLNNNSLTDISNRTFWDLLELHYLSIAHNRISSIHPEVLSRNTKLKVLNLNGNPLLLVPGQPILTTQSLQNLSLNNCNISRLSETAFQGVTNLQILSVKYNNFQSINVSTLYYLTQLHHLDMSNNPLNCNGTLQEVWIWCKNNNIAGTATCQKPKGDWKILEHLNFDPNESDCNNKSQSMIDIDNDHPRSLLKILLRYSIAFGVFIFCVGIILLLRRIINSRVYDSYYYYENSETLMNETVNQSMPTTVRETTRPLEISIPNSHQREQTEI